MENGKLNGFNDGLHPSSGIGGGQSAAEMMAEMSEAVVLDNCKDKMFVPYDLACILKAKGFNLQCIYSYFEDGTVGSAFNWVHYNSSETLVARPMYQQVSDWFRLKHKYSLTVYQETEWTKPPKYTGRWSWEISKIGEFEPVYDSNYGVEDEYYKSWYTIVKQALTLIPETK